MFNSTKFLLSISHPVVIIILNSIQIYNLNEESKYQYILSITIPIIMNLLSYLNAKIKKENVDLKKEIKELKTQIQSLNDIIEEFKKDNTNNLEELKRDNTNNLEELKRDNENKNIERYNELKKSISDLASRQNEHIINVKNSKKSKSRKKYKKNYIAINSKRRK